MRAVGWYIILISAFAVLLTVYDKIAAKQFPRSRVPERVLMGIGAAGGALTMLVTMRLIRHKTLHKKFMIGLPLMIAAQAAAIGLIWYWLG